MYIFSGRTGAELKENSPAKNATFDHSSGLWTIMVENSDTVYKGRVLVCADGAPSKMAIHLGLVSQPPQGSCSRSYIESGTHMFKADGVVFYNKGLLPGTPMHVHNHIRTASVKKNVFLST